jgi:hypothetical protein
MCVDDRCGLLVSTRRGGHDDVRQLDARAPATRVPARNRPGWCDRLIGVKWWPVLVVSMAACGPGAGDEAPEQRCATITELFSYPMQRRVEFADTTGDAVPEVWLLDVEEREDGDVTVADGLRRGADGVYAAAPGFEIPGAFAGFADFDGDGRDDVYTAFSVNVECGNWNERHPSGTDGLPGPSAGEFLGGCYNEIAVIDAFGDARDDFVAVENLYRMLSVELVADGESIHLVPSPEFRPQSAHSVAGDPTSLLVVGRGDDPDVPPSLALFRLDDAASQLLWDVEVPGLDMYEVLPATRTVGVRVLVRIEAEPNDPELHEIDIDDDGTMTHGGIVAADVGAIDVADLDGDGHDDLAWHAASTAELHVRFGDQNGAFEPEQTYPDIVDGWHVLDHDGDGAFGLGFATEGPAADASYSIVELKACGSVE